jgi:IPT/TIG domain/PASTA domain
MVVIAAAWALVAATAAQAGTITVGSVLPPGSSATPLGQVATFFNTALPESGANLASPVSGAIVRWRMQDAEGGPFYLRVLRPNGSGAYTAIGTSNPVTPSGLGVQTFAANLPIKAGDLIGVDPTNDTDKIGISEVAGASYGFIFPPPLDTATVAPSGSVAGKEIALSAEVQPAPAIGSIAPNFGPIGGGTTVVITGTNLTGTSAVKFGPTPAAGFTVESDTQITAISPPSKAVGPVNVTATTLAGTSATTNADQFFYQGCVVPKVQGRMLKASRKALRRAHCRIGTIKRRNKGRPGRVLRQRPRAGTVLESGSKVNLIVGR